MAAGTISADVRTLLQPCPPPDQSARGLPTDAVLHGLALRVRGEFEEMPGLRLTVAQAARLFGLSADDAHRVLEHLRHLSILSCSSRGNYALNR